MQVLLGSAQALSRHESVWGSRKYGEKVLIWLPCKCCLALHPRCHDMRGNFTKFFMERSMWAVSGLCCKDLRRSDVNMMLLGPPYYSTSNCHDLLAHTKLSRIPNQRSGVEESVQTPEPVGSHHIVAMPFVGPLNEYKAPLTGHEKRLSGLQRMQQSLFEKNNTKHVKTLRSMKAHVDTTAPVRKYKHIPRHEHPATLVRQKEIAAENIRLLHKMTKIFGRPEKESVHGTFDPWHDASIYDQMKAKDRERRQRRVQEENKVIMKRILKTEPYYTKREWEQHTKTVYKQMEHRCKFENQVFTLKLPPIAASSPSTQPSLAVTVPSAAPSFPKFRQQLQERTSIGLVSSPNALEEEDQAGFEEDLQAVDLEVKVETSQLEVVDEVEEEDEDQVATSQEYDDGTLADEETSDVFERGEGQEQGSGEGAANVQAAGDEGCHEAQGRRKEVSAQGAEMIEDSAQRGEALEHERPKSRGLGPRSKPSPCCKSVYACTLQIGVETRA